MSTLAHRVRVTALVTLTALAADLLASPVVPSAVASTDDAWDRYVQVTGESERLWWMLTHSIDTATAAAGEAEITAADRAAAKAEIEGLRDAAGAALAKVCGPGGRCAAADVIEAIALTVDDYLVKREPAVFSLADEVEVPANSRLRAFGRRVSAYALYTATVFALGYGMDLIPAGAGPAKTMVAILAGTIIGDAGAFWRDSLGAKLRTFFFKLANGVKAEAAKLPVFSRFQQIWQNGKDMASDTVRDGRNMENAALFVEMGILTEAAREPVPRETAVEMVAYAMERFRLTFFDISTGAAGTLTPENSAAIEKMFGLTLKTRFGNAEAFFEVMTALKVRDLEYAGATAERKAEIMKRYRELGVQWFQPERWTTPTAGTALLAEYDQRAADLDRVAAEREAERKRLVDESAKAAAAACGKTAAGAARGG